MATYHPTERRDDAHGAINQIDVPAGETTKWIFVSAFAGITVDPGGGQMSVQCTRSLPSKVNADNADGTSTALAYDWPSGDVTEVTSDFVDQATAVRFTATGASGVAEISR